MTTKDPKKGVEEPDPDKTAGEGSEGDDNPESEGERTVPLSVLKAVTRDNQKLKADLARLSGLVEGLKAGQPKSEAAPERVYTRAELTAAKNEGKITEEQMEALWEKQIEAKLEKKFAAKSVETATAMRADAQVGTDLGRYTEAYPELTDEGSELRGKVQAAYDRLVRRGYPDNANTELTAVEMAVGPLTPNKGRKKQPEPHEETGGAGEEAKGRTDTGLFKGIPAKLKAHYQKQIDKGIYKGSAGEKALKAELDMARRPN